MAFKTVCEIVPSMAHREAGAPCEDFAHISNYGEHVVMVVADGAGSKQYVESHRASAIAVFAAIHHARQFINPETIRSASEWKPALKAVMDRTQTDLETVANGMAIPVDRFATTLIVTAATAGTVVTAQCGDGAVVVETRNSELISAGAAFDSRFANYTQFLTPNAPIGFKRCVLPVRNIMSFSDGIEPAAILGGKPFEGFFRPVFRWSTELPTDACRERIKNLLNSDGVQLLGDDVSCVVATVED
ncbi:MAG: protein phosphatase 2C domain-containing protein [Planctomycetales bacterium]|nr:protein phosphatase 2C domain-containing protein [Planctomycetales bacterium]